MEHPIFHAASKVYKDELWISGGTFDVKGKDDVIYASSSVYVYNPKTTKWDKRGTLPNERMKHIMESYREYLVVVGGVKTIESWWSKSCFKRYYGVHHEKRLVQDINHWNGRWWGTLGKVESPPCIPEESFNWRKKKEFGENNPDALEEKIAYRYQASSASWGNRLGTISKVCSEVVFLLAESLSIRPSGLISKKVVAGGYYMNFGEDTLPKCKDPKQWRIGQRFVPEIMVLHWSRTAGKSCNRGGSEGKKDGTKMHRWVAIGNAPIMQPIGRDLFRFLPFSI